MLYSVDLFHWSERSACASRAALQTGCVANVVGTVFVVILLFSFSALTFFPEGVHLGSWKFVCALIRVKIDEKWRKKTWGAFFSFLKKNLNHSQRTLNDESSFRVFENQNG